jgi:D-arginine dehydrogenase
VSLSKARYDPTKKWTLNLASKLPDQSTDDVEITADLVINASGAWADHTNEVLGAKKHAIQPKQRTIIQFLPDEYVKAPNQTTDPLESFNQWPSIFDMHDRYYYKPDAGRVLASPCDEVDVEPGDVQPDELTMAITVARLSQASFFQPQNIIHKWAGMRSFAPDREFVMGLMVVTQARNSTTQLVLAVT